MSNSTIWLSLYNFFPAECGEIEKADFSTLGCQFFSSYIWIITSFFFMARYTYRLKILKICFWKYEKCNLTDFNCFIPLFIQLPTHFPPKACWISAKLFAFVSTTTKAQNAHPTNVKPEKIQKVIPIPMASVINPNVDVMANARSQLNAPLTGLAIAL